MKFGDKASDSFFLVQVDSEPDDVLALLQDGPMATHVVVHRVEDDDEYYYLFTRDEAGSMLGASSGDVRSRLNLHESTSTEVRPSAQLMDGGAPERAVVMGEAGVVGFVDRSGPVRRGPVGTPRMGAGAELVEGSLEAEFPDEVEQHAEVSLLVSLVAESQAPGAIEVSLEAGSMIDVIVQPRKGFEVVGAFEQKLEVVDPNDALPVRFKIRGVDLGPGEIRVLAYHDGACLGQMRLQSDVLPAGTPSSAPVTHVHEIEPSVEQTPDLTLLIEESQAGGGLEYFIRLIAGDPALGLSLQRYGPLKLTVDPLAYFSDFFKDIESLKVKTDDEKAEASRVMERKGAELYELVFPDDLKKVMWRVRDRIQSLIIQSEEPWIPWEICRMSGEDDDGTILEGPFLCEKYIISRWNPAESFKQPLSLKETALVVPQDSGLAFAEAERDMVIGFETADRNVTSIRAAPADVQAALASGAYTAFHFTGHGVMKDENPDRSAMKLEQGKVFRPEDVSGVVGNLKKGRPIVFLNACQIGAGAMGLTGMGGWAQRFVTNGAGAFLGAYWSVFDQPALSFAEAFYDELISGKPIGKAVFEARKSIRDLGDPTWLAYTLFAHPLSSVQ